MYDVTHWAPGMDGTAENFNPSGICAESGDFFSSTAMKKEHEEKFAPARWTDPEHGIHLGAGIIGGGRQAVERAVEAGLSAVEAGVPRWNRGTRQAHGSHDHDGPQHASAPEVALPTAAPMERPDARDHNRHTDPYAFLVEDRLYYNDATTTRGRYFPESNLIFDENRYRSVQAHVKIREAAAQKKRDEQLPPLFSHRFPLLERVGDAELLPSCTLVGGQAVDYR